MKSCLLFLQFTFVIVISDDSYANRKLQVGCDEEYLPPNCGYPNITLEKIKVVEDFDRCGPAITSKPVRNLAWGTAGRQNTYQRNLKQLKKLVIIPRVLRNLSQYGLFTNILGKRTDIPLGISPTAGQKLFHLDGDVATAKASAASNAVMILSSLSGFPMEQVADATFSVNRNASLWIQIDIQRPRKNLEEYIKRAEAAGFQAIVITLDDATYVHISCNARNLYKFKKYSPNTRDWEKLHDADFSFDDVKWLVKATKLPVIAKGILSVDDAIEAAKAGVAAIFVSNHGGRTVDSEISTIEALPMIATALRHTHPNIDIYLDGGVRNGWDIFKALALGAKAVFVGRPTLWALAIGGEEGVLKMLSIFKQEFKEAMLNAGYANPREIGPQAILQKHSHHRTVSSSLDACAADKYSSGGERNLYVINH